MTISISMAMNAVDQPRLRAEEEDEPQAPTGSEPIPAWRLSA